MTTLSESFFGSLKKIITSCTIQYIKSMRMFILYIYKHACFDVLKKALTITNSSSVNTLF